MEEKTRIDHHTIVNLKEESEQIAGALAEISEAIECHNMGIDRIAAAIIFSRLASAKTEKYSFDKARELYFKCLRMVEQKD